MTEHAALIYIMVLVAAADANMTDRELLTIGNIIRTLPVFRDFDEEQLPKTAESCADILGQERGLDTVLQLVKGALPKTLRETAYALACDITAADGRVSNEESRMLNLLRVGLGVGRLPAAAIDRGARARWARG
ncbi:MAG: hypothetical protein FJX56_00260 [Alphaproteobacteria bacterium]|nr:hypothetical protein [Alphaproteobacteria bacterium]